MIERKQPVVVGINKKGELRWKFIDMPRWQMEMFRVKYYGDFMIHWIKRCLFDETGYELENMASVNFDNNPRKRNTRQSTGD